MDAYRTEEEQVEALKQWWKRNGTSTLATIALMLAAYFGWQAWQDRRFAHAEAASFDYQQLLMAAAQIEQEPSEKRYATAQHLAGRLRDEFSGTVYAQYAALLQAGLLVQQNDLDGAAEQLRWVLDADPEEAVAEVANLRLARVLHARGDDKGALAIIEQGDHGHYAAAYYELRGDIEYGAGRLDEARGSYEKALQSGGQTGPVASPLVRIKLQSLPGGAAGDVPVAVQEG